MDRRNFNLSWLKIMEQNIFLSYPDVNNWLRQFRMGRESVKDSKQNGRLADFQTHFKIEGALETSPNASVRDIVQITDIVPSTVFYVLTQVLHLEFCNWRWVPTNWTTIRNKHEHNLLFRCKPSLREHSGGTGYIIHRWWVLDIMEKFSERMLVESGREALRMGSSKDRDREINIDSFSI
jgi:hypothetical protein